MAQGTLCSCQSSFGFRMIFFALADQLEVWYTSLLDQCPENYCFGAWWDQNLIQIWSVILVSIWYIENALTDQLEIWYTSINGWNRFILGVVRPAPNLDLMRDFKRCHKSTISQDVRTFAGFQLLLNWILI